MLDLETASTRPDAAILSIAIVPFSLDANEPAPEVDHYYEVIDMLSCWLEGDKADEATQEWWMRQDPRAKHELQSRQGIIVRTAIREAYNYLCYLAEQYELVIWSQGVDFDFPILEHALASIRNVKNYPTFIGTRWMYVPYSNWRA